MLKGRKTYDSLFALDHNRMINDVKIMQDIVFKGQIDFISKFDFSAANGEKLQKITLHC